MEVFTSLTPPSEWFVDRAVPQSLAIRCHDRLVGRQSSARYRARCFVDVAAVDGRPQCSQSDSQMRQSIPCDPRLCLSSRAVLWMSRPAIVKLASSEAIYRQLTDLLSCIHDESATSIRSSHSCSNVIRGVPNAGKSYRAPQLSAG